MMHEFLGPFWLALITGLFFFCCVKYLVEYIRQFSREPTLDDLDFDNGHPDGFVRNYASSEADLTPQ
jgi:hypothetical protein